MGKVSHYRETFVSTIIVLMAFNSKFLESENFFPGM